MLCGFQSVTLFGETSVKNMSKENRLRNPICVAYVQFFLLQGYMAACLCIELLWEGRGVLADGYSSCFVQWKLSFSAVFWTRGLEEHWVLLFCCFAFLPWIAVGCVVLPGVLGKSYRNQASWPVLCRRGFCPHPLSCAEITPSFCSYSLLFRSKAPLMRKKIKKSRALKVYREDRSKRRRQLTLGKAPEKSPALFLTRDWIPRWLSRPNRSWTMSKIQQTSRETATSVSGGRIIM